MGTGRVTEIIRRSTHRPSFVVSYVNVFVRCSACLSRFKNKDKMPKTKSNLGSSITRWLEPYNRDKTVFTTSGLVIYCQVCDRQVRCNKKFQITQHVTTEFHLKCLKKSSNNSKQILMGVKSIKNLERSSLTLCDSIKIVNNVILAMEKVPGQQGKIIQEKLLYLIEKNVGFQTAKQITAILSGIKRNPENSDFGLRLATSSCIIIRNSTVTDTSYLYIILEISQRASCAVRPLMQLGEVRVVMLQNRLPSSSSIIALQESLVEYLSES
ncbi:hypothetical protein QTP88_017275 [Uroleucon formosanum]